MKHISKLLDGQIETLGTQMNTVIRANTTAAANWDFGFETFGEATLSEMLAAAQAFIREMASGAAPRWLSYLGQSGTGKTHLARRINQFFRSECRIYVEPATGAHLSRRGGFISWRKAVNHLRDGDYGIMDALSNDWFVALDDIGAERGTDYSVSKLDEVINARLGKWTVITSNFTRKEIADYCDVRIASRLGRGDNVVVDNIQVRDYSTRQKLVA